MAHSDEQVHTSVAKILRRNAPHRYAIPKTTHRHDTELIAKGSRKLGNDTGLSCLVKDIGKMTKMTTFLEPMNFQDLSRNRLAKVRSTRTSMLVTLQYIFICCLLLRTLSCNPLGSKRESLQQQHQNTNSSKIKSSGSVSKAPAPLVKVLNDTIINLEPQENSSNPDGPKIPASAPKTKSPSAEIGIDKSIFDSRVLPPNDTLTSAEVTTRVGKNKSGKGRKVDFSKLFREETDNYPEDEIKLLLKQTPDEIKNLFNVLNTPLDPNVNLTERTAYYHGDDDIREESICRSAIRNIYPREANRENSLVYVPNTQEFMQVIQAEICHHPDQECNYLQDSLPYGMSSICHQKYAYKKLLYLDPLEKRMATDLFRYPSCCSCYIRNSPLDLRTSMQQTNSSRPPATNEPTNPKQQRNQITTTSKIPPPKENFKATSGVSHELDIDDFDVANNTNLKFKVVKENSDSSVLVTSSSLEDHEPLAAVTHSARRSKALTVANGSTLGYIANDEQQKRDAILAKSIDDRRVKRVESSSPKTQTAERSQTTTTVSPAANAAPKRKQTNTTQTTIVLQEDKVYTPNS